ncbi:alpha/beta hydrolase [Fundicoccus culcitae]|uniref:Alpha/beta hydrolase n=1 Tax=Fundicoccus culcitae TaxID=2969821 RepID=A0ABY5P6Y9_9LACT|nr:alpha/beta hydrolase [Fundicoccus culcitae]UUX34304.1 alpha/beta hydrolase [Fundicoccus culcitae]
MPKNKLLKTTAKIAKTLTISGLAYHFWYQKNANLIRTNPGEIELPNEEPIPLDWVDSQHYGEAMEQKVKPYIEKYRKQQVLPLNAYPIAIDTYQLPNPDQTLLIVHGFNEYKEKFHELIYYFLQANIQVVVYDQRGHGFSKIDENQTQINIKDFNEYVVDLNHIIHQIVLPMSQNNPLILFGHSMGGAVVTSYLIKEEPTIVDAVVLNAPMIEIETGKYPQSLSHLVSHLMSQTPFGNLYIPTTEAYDPQIHTLFNADNDLTHYPVRNEYTHYLNNSLHKIPTRGGSYHWLATSLSHLWEIRKPENIKKIKQAVLLFRAEDDVIVGAEGIFTLNQYLPKVTPIFVPNSKHEIFQENDQIVQAYISQIIKFIRETTQKPNV